MGGRGGSSGMGGGSGSPAYKEAYNDEVRNARNFAAAFTLDEGMSRDTIGYQMNVHRTVTGNSLIADTEKEVKFLKRELREANAMGRSYGMTKDEINGMKAGIREKIRLREKALEKMNASRANFEKYAKQARVANTKNKGRKWM